MPKLQKRSEKSKSQPHPETLKGWKQIAEFLGEYGARFRIGLGFLRTPMVGLSFSMKLEISR